MVRQVFVIMDFDGVINWYSTSPDEVSKNFDSFGQLRHASVPLNSNVTGGWGKNDYKWQDISWSHELVETLMKLKDETAYVWHWLSTWTNETEKVDELLGINSDGWISWTPTPFLPVEDIQAYRSDQKLQWVLNFARSNPDTAFVWVDDEAVNLWAEEHVSSMTAPHLVVRPCEKFGLGRSDVTRISNFIRTNSV